MLPVYNIFQLTFLMSLANLSKAHANDGDNYEQYGTDSKHRTNDYAAFVGTWQNRDLWRWAVIRKCAVNGNQTAVCELSIWTIAPHKKHMLEK